MRTIWRIAACLLLFLATGSLAGTPARVTNEEYGYSVVFPPGAKPCPAMSWTHVHGAYATYGAIRVPCGKDPGPDSMSLSIWADGNTLFHATPREDMAQDCVETRPELLGLKASDLVVDGRPAVLCVKSEGARKFLVVTVMAGKLEGFGDEDGKPAFVYDITLVTTQARLMRDVPVYATFLKSIRLRW